jgi:hypothetical protein
MALRSGPGVQPDFYLSWDAASWDVSKKLFERIDIHNVACAITLAGAAEGQIDEKQIPEGTPAHLFRVLRSKFAPEPVNEDVT